MRVRIPGETQRAYRYVLGLTLSQIIVLLIGGAVGLQLYASSLSLSLKAMSLGVVTLLTLLFSFIRWPLRGGEPLWVWAMRLVHFILLAKVWTNAQADLVIQPSIKRIPAPTPRKATELVVTPIHPYMEPVRIARSRKPLQADVGSVKLTFVRKGRDVLVTTQQGKT